MTRPEDRLLSVGAMSGHPTVSEWSNSAGQEPVSRKSAFTTFVGPCSLLDACGQGLCLYQQPFRESSL